MQLNAIMTAGVLLAISSSLQAATFTRTCNGWIEIQYQDNATGGKSSVSINHLKAEGNAWTIAAARHEARNRIHDCYQDHWDNRWDFHKNEYSFSLAFLPDSCTAGHIKGYHGGDVDLKTNIEEAVWENYLKSVDPSVLVDGGVYVKVLAKSSGGGVVEACDRTRTLTDGYLVKRSWFDN
ncbi:MAG: hypothetical protein M3Q07_20085 [Pseudobdellovibrionaceae bacterium]|uniref:hypothetical protein n=1 Tax=Oligoflexus sp. TaxID=1971216 RepID=UPI0027BD9A73|nr:hypothetical protein [Oligoflexus sp.]MDQ3234114.1 hypothetical protein [Pseudobdellovibrionaceae bacterium]HYX38692.1 hypothetical protein [Oligoflexus sp.]